MTKLNVVKSDYRDSCKIIALLCISAIGPYIIPAAGVRLEHLFIYPAFLVIMFKIAYGKNTIKNSNFDLLITLITINIIIFIISMFSLNWPTIYVLLAGIENFTQPVALILIISFATNKLDNNSRLRLLQFSCFLIILLLCLNTFLTIYSFLYDASAFIEYFTAAGLQGNYEDTVSALALSAGRRMGIFNQPVESGLAYSIGLLAWAYLKITKENPILVNFFSLVLLILGGALALSKVFFFGGIQLFLLYLLWPSRKRQIFYINILYIFFVGLFIAGFLAYFSHLWPSYNSFIGMFDSENYADQNLIESLTATRYGIVETGNVQYNFRRVLIEAPLFGFGINNFGSDSGYLDFFSAAGLIGLFLYLLILFTILRVGLTGWIKRAEAGKLLTVIGILISGASLGAPTLTMNRVSIFLWILIILIISTVSEKRRGYIFKSSR